MGKRIEDLPLDDTEIIRTQPEDARQTAWYQFVVEIEDLLATGKYGWAQQTLEDIQVTVERLQRVSEGQRRAVANIEARGQERARSRRYEGFPRW